MILLSSTLVICGQLTQELDVGSGQQLVKYVEVSLTGMLFRNTRLKNTKSSINNRIGNNLIHSNSVSNLEK